MGNERASDRGDGAFEDGAGVLPCSSYWNPGDGCERGADQLRVLAEEYRWLGGWNWSVGTERQRDYFHRFRRRVGQRRARRNLGRSGRRSGELGSLRFARRFTDPRRRKLAPLREGRRTTRDPSADGCGRGRARSDEGESRRIPVVSILRIPEIQRRVSCDYHLLSTYSLVAYGDSFERKLSRGVEFFLCGNHAGTRTVGECHPQQGSDQFPGGGCAGGCSDVLVGWSFHIFERVFFQRGLYPETSYRNGAQKHPAPALLRAHERVHTGRSRSAGLVDCRSRDLHRLRVSR